jgi:hypothetical protein
MSLKKMSERMHCRAFPQAACPSGARVLFAESWAVPPRSCAACGPAVRAATLPAPGCHFRFRRPPASGRSGNANRLFALDADAGRENLVKL